MFSLCYPHGEMYTTQKQIEARLGRDMTESEVAYFTDTLSGAIDLYINRMTGTAFGTQTTELTNLYVDGTDSQLLIIPAMSNIDSVTQINDDGSQSTLTLNTDYKLYPSGQSPSLAIRKVGGGNWVEGFENYVIHGNLGYTDIPGDIKVAATELAVLSLNENVTAYKSEKVGDWAVTYKEAADGLSTATMQTLANYNRLARSI